LSKGLGAPVGSLLLGPNELIQRARRYRKVIGGGMRQAGYLAAAGLYALQNNVDRLREDNRRARELGAAVEAMSFATNVRPVQSNICIFDLTQESAETFLAKLAEHQIQAVPFGPRTIRFTTHLEVDDAMIARVISVLNEVEHASK
jgi:threonine aldolase